jgi:hypothetical protein
MSAQIIPFPRRNAAEPFMPIRHVSRTLEVTPRTLHRWIADGLASRYERGQRCVRISEARAWQLALREQMRRQYQEA